MNHDQSPRKPYFQTDFDAHEFAARRHRVLDAIGDEAVAVLQGAPASGAFDIFRQHNDFYYLCGVEVPHAYLLLDGRNRSCTLYLPPCDPKHERSEGPSLSADDAELACALTGVDHVKLPRALEGDLSGVGAVYTPTAGGEGRQACRDTLSFAREMIQRDPWDGWPSPESRFRDKLANLCPAATICDLTPVLDRLRLIKSAAELAVMRRAGNLTALAVVEAMRCTRSGMLEFQLAAVADYVFNVNGASGCGYCPIVASGDNIWNAHYYRNNCRLEDGDLVLMDYAPDYRNYTSDIGRIWPVGGTYTDWQRELYGFIVAYHKALLQRIRPGVPPAKIYAEARTEMEPVVERTRWSNRAFEQAAREALTFDRHLTHPVGMAVHDVGVYHDEPLRPGIVFALDPQLWVPDQELYIRVEDTVAVTETGVENLTATAPLELDEVERVMQESGICQSRPDLIDSGPSDA